MKLLFISSRGALVPFAFRAKHLGHDVVVWLRDQSKQWDGLVPKVAKFGEALTKEHTVIFDSLGGGKTAERLRRQGYRVVGSSELHDSFGDPEFARRELGKAGVKLSERFGERANSPGLWIEGWFTGERWLHPALGGFSWRRLMPGELGPDIKSSMAVVVPLSAMDKGVESSLWRVTVLLQRARYCGLMAFEFDPDGLVTNVRTTVVPEMFAAGQHVLDYTGLIQALTSKDATRLPTLSAAGVAVRVTQPFPRKDVLIDGVTKEMLPYVDFFDVMNDPNNFLVTAGANGHVATVSAGGKDVVEAGSRAYGVLSELKFRDRQFRIDLIGSFLALQPTFHEEVVNA